MARPIGLRGCRRVRPHDRAGQPQPPFVAPEPLRQQPPVQRADRREPVKGDDQGAVPEDARRRGRREGPPLEETVGHPPEVGTAQAGCAQAERVQVEDGHARWPSRDMRCCLLVQSGASQSAVEKQTTERGSGPGRPAGHPAGVPGGSGIGGPRPDRRRDDDHDRDEDEARTTCGCRSPACQASPSPRSRPGRAARRRRRPPPPPPRIRPGRHVPGAGASCARRGRGPRRSARPGARPRPARR